MQCLKSAVVILLAAPVFGSGGNPEAGLTVHEWGTFTTIADQNGASEPWSPLGGVSDLPCFVIRLNGLQYKMMPQGPTAPVTQTVTVRMETPVMYFYSPRRTTVSVGVDFPKGLITEWYPNASKVSPGPQLNLPPVRAGHIEWNSLQILPDEQASLPRIAGASHYFAARNTDSDLVRIGQQQEKFLFYRGIANFGVPLRARVTGKSSVEVSNTGDDPLALAILFENRAGQIGYRAMRGFRGSNYIEAPALTGSLDGLKQDWPAPW